MMRAMLQAEGTMRWQIETRSRTVDSTGDGEEVYGPWSPWTGEGLPQKTFPSADDASQAIPGLAASRHEHRQTINSGWVETGAYRVRVYESDERAIEHEYRAVQPVADA